MDLVQNSKSSVGVSYVNSAETASHSFDCVGFDAVSVDAIVQTNEETTAPAVVKFEVSDDNTTFATVTGLMAPASVNGVMMITWLRADI